MSFLKGTAIGNIGQDAEVRATQDGKYFVTFSVGTKKRGRDAGTQWVEVSAWGRLAETMMNLIQNNGALSKGDKVYVEGSIELNEYQKNDGTNGSSIRMSADDITLLGSRSDAPQQQDQGYGNQQQYQQPQQGYQQAPQQQAPQQGFAPPPPPQQFQGYGQS